MKINKAVAENNNTNPTTANTQFTIETDINVIPPLIHLMFSVFRI